ncbi:MerR family DNA-binding transcriptional regulator [Jatrophihabitans telluris]|uniref:MerR family DNA-binding transcriptional regulator n=1 Tax=Jatrophihabitans telluris TaxID=2038343 RepID=A0ABY4R5E4_9ACTN|nr:MerR family transcriptional regulator [Jatrophihabitans telluris]UQX90136.1 MerR family DNA-binding transcriptional regulator [Jatrophihabitans telluris]
MSAASLPARGSLSIGEVLSQLRNDFPDVTISKIRFLEEQGLVQPDRTPSGYRKFSTSDVARLRYVLSQQRDHYLPLRVIKDQLEAIDRGHSPSGPGGVPRAAHLAITEGLPSGEHFRSAPAALRLTREELLNTAGLTSDQLRELEQFGLIASRAGGVYDDDALAVARVVAELGRFGIEGRHLRSFKSAADREVGLFAQVAGPMRQRSGDGRARAEETIRELAALSVRLHTALVQIGLRDISS